MSRIDRIGVLNGTRVETGHLDIELLQCRYPTDIGSSLLHRRRAPVPYQPVYGSATSVATDYSLPSAEHKGAHKSALTKSARKKAAAGGLRGIGRSVAAVLTSVMKIPRLLLPRKARAHLNRLRCERRAMDPGVRWKADLLDISYDATLDRLGDNWKEPAWWRRVVLSAECDYILPYGKSDGDPTAPHFLRIESVREWLSDYDVRADLKALATERILVDGTDTGVIRDRLAQSYAHHTLNDPIMAQVPIDTVVSGLAAGALSSLAPSQQIIVSLIRESNIRINRSNTEVLAAISRIESMLAARPAEPKRQCQRDADTLVPAKVPASISIGLS